MHGVKKLAPYCGELLASVEGRSEDEAPLQQAQRLEDAPIVGAVEGGVVETVARICKVTLVVTCRQQENSHFHADSRIYDSVFVLPKGSRGGALSALQGQF